MVKIRVLHAVSRGTDVSECAKEVPTTANVGQVLQSIADVVKLKLSDIEMRHCAKRVANEATFASAGIADTHTVYIVRNHSTTPLVFDRRRPFVGAHASLPAGKAAQVLREFQRHFSSRKEAVRVRLINVLWDRQFIGETIASIPQLHDDLVAQRILRDPFVLRNIMFNEADMKTALGHHPGLLLGMDAVLVKAKLPPSADEPPEHAAYIVEVDSDDDEPMDQGQQRRQQQPAPRQMITPQQLAAALAGGVAPPTPAAGGAVTPAMLQNVMGNLFGAQQPAAVPARPTEESLAAKSAELVVMGFADTVANRAALLRANGDIAQALDILCNQRQQQFDLD